MRLHLADISVEMDGSVLNLFQGAFVAMGSAVRQSWQAAANLAKGVTEMASELEVVSMVPGGAIHYDVRS